MELQATFCSVSPTSDIKSGGGKWRIESEVRRVEIVVLRVQHGERISDWTGVWRTKIGVWRVAGPMEWRVGIESGVSSARVLRIVSCS